MLLRGKVKVDVEINCEEILLHNLGQAANLQVGEFFSLN